MTIEVLLNRGANIESHDMDGFTILHTAAYTSRPKCLTYLLEAGANINAAITGGSTAIDLAIQGNKHEALRVLIAHIRHHSSSGTPYGRLVFVHAAFWGDIETLENSKTCAFSDADIKATYNGWTAVELAKWRRDFNEAWSKKCLQPPDEDPQEWYAAFEELLNGVVKAQREAEDEHSSRDFVEEEASSCEENSDEESVDNVEAQEVWEDARESPH